jgi:two-component system, OmpR family, sensor histidine kinase BaeS
VAPDRDDHRQLLSVFHHEAGTPVALIGSVLRHLQRGGSLRPEDEEMVAAAGRQLDVLERLLDQVRVANEDDLQLAAEPVELGEVVDELVADLGHTVLEQHPTQVHAPHGAVWVEADPARIRQLLSNLLDNAAQYSEPGTVVEVEVRREEDRAVIWVTDQGTGIAPPDLERIFERYERADEDTEGLGLGLYVVWRIVEAHGGSVEALPAPSAPGTRFVVTLPALES